jgi:hypothetical protein
MTREPFYIRPYDWEVFKTKFDDYHNYRLVQEAKYTPETIHQALLDNFPIDPVNDVCIGNLDYYLVKNKSGLKPIMVKKYHNLPNLHVRGTNELYRWISENYTEEVYLYCEHNDVLNDNAIVIPHAAIRGLFK